MDETRRRKLFEDMLREALNDSTNVPPAKPRTKPVVPCGCIDKCDDVSKHDENTVLEGTILDADDRTFEASRVQDRFQFGAGMSKL